MSRCKYIVRNKSICLEDGKMYSIFTCSNKKCKQYLNNSIGNASICNNCLLHERKLEEIIEK